MAHLDSIVLDLALILPVASLVTLLFKKINQPIVLGYIVAGFLISPNFTWLPTVINANNITVWANIGIVFLMFAIGLEFNFHKIAKVGGGAIITAVVVITAMVTIGYSVGQLLGWSAMDSAFLGCMISMSSTMIVLKAYGELKLKHQKFAMLVVGALVIEDVAGIFMMIILTTMSVATTFSGVEMAKEIGILLLLLIIILCIGIYIIPTIVKKITRLINDETLLIFALGFCLLMVVICVSIGFSEALGAFLAGSILAGTRQAERIERLVKPIQDLFGAVFFVSVGMMIIPSMLVEYWKEILLITVVVIFGQSFFSCLGCIISGQSLHTSVRVGFSMLQVGEFSFIIATLGTTLGVTSDFLYPIIVCVSVITAFTTPMFIKRGDRAYKKLEKVLPAKVKNFLENYTSERRGPSAPDRDWTSYLVFKGRRMLIGIAGLAGTTFLVTNVIEHYVFEIMQHEMHVAEMLMLIGTLIIMIPFINIMCSRKGMLYVKLWYKTRFNRLPLLAVRGISIFIALVFVMAILRRYLFTLPMIVHVIIAFGVVVFIMRSDFIKGQNIKLETRFSVNFNERIIEREQLERNNRSDKIWVDEKMQIIEFELVENTGKEYIKNLISNKAFGCMIISIFRQNKEHIILPKASTKLQNGDILTVVGSVDGIRAYTTLLQNDNKIKEPKNGAMSLKEFLYFQMFDDDIRPENQFMCCALRPLQKADFMARRSIKDSYFIAKYNGYIIAVEREGLQMISPGRNLILEENDIIWCIGTQDMVGRLENDELLML